MNDVSRWNALCGANLLLLLLVVAVFLGRLLVQRPIDGIDEAILGWPEPTVLGFRSMAAISGVLVGGALGLSGLLLQSLLRNPLASPFVLGVSSGAGLGVIVAMALAILVPALSIPAAGSIVPAAAGSLVALLIVWAIGTRRGLIDPIAVILAGVIIGTLSGALIMLVQSLVPGGVRSDMVLWMMGRIPESPPVQLLWSSGVVLLVSFVIAQASSPAMDVAMLQDDEAHSIGVNLGRLKNTQFILAGILAAASVTIAGPIGFVGLMAPHAARRIVGPGHGRLVLASTLSGALIVLLADVARQWIDLGTGRLPIGVMTALAGGPVFLYLLKRPGGFRWNS